MSDDEIFSQSSMDDLIQWDEQRQQEEDEQQWYDFLRNKEERFGREGLVAPFLEENYSIEELEQMDEELYDDNSEGLFDEIEP